MKQENMIPEGTKLRGEDGNTIFTVRMKNSILNRLEELSARSIYSRNRLINMLLETALDDVQVTDEEQQA